MATTTTGERAERVAADQEALEAARERLKADANGRVDLETGELVPPPKPFQQFLVEQRQGALHSDLSEQLQELVRCVSEYGKPGALGLVIKVEPGKKGAAHLVITDEIKVKAPEPDRGASIFYSDEHGNLSRSDPRQPQLPFREVPKSETNVREVGA